MQRFDQYEAMVAGCFLMMYANKEGETYEKDFIRGVVWQHEGLAQLVDYEGFKRRWTEMNQLGGRQRLEQELIRTLLQCPHKYCARVLAWMQYTARIEGGIDTSEGGLLTRLLTVLNMTWDEVKRELDQLPA